MILTLRMFRSWHNSTSFLDLDLGTPPPTLSGQHSTRAPSVGHTRELARSHASYVGCVCEPFCPCRRGEKKKKIRESEEDNLGEEIVGDGWESNEGERDFLGLSHGILGKKRKNSWLILEIPSDAYLKLCHCFHSFQVSFTLFKGILTLNLPLPCSLIEPNTHRKIQTFRTVLGPNSNM